MDKGILFILNQIAEAKKCARANRKLVYCFLQDGQWYLSGKMPKKTSQYYVIYPNGDLDQSSFSPKITDAQWEEFRALPDATANCWPSGASVPACSWSSYWRLFLCYCAFAPHAALALTMLLYKIVWLQNLWELAFIASILCLPFSLLFAFAPLYRPKSGTIAATCSMLASDGHMLLYAYLYVLSVTGEEEWLAPVLMVSLMASAVSYLFLLYNKLPAQNV